MSKRRKRLRDESTPEGRKIWAAVDKAADRAPDWLKRPVLLRCLKPKCPRTRRVEREKTDPAGTVEIRMLCPWHQSSGDKTEDVHYFNAAGRELEWQP